MIERHTTERGLNLIAESTEKPYGVFLKHGSMELGYYKPNVTDRQQPHRQDEIYIIQSGSGYIVTEDSRQPFQAGEALFVRAGIVHRFEDFTEDFAAWVIFYGPDNGET